MHRLITQIRERGRQELRNNLIRNVYENIRENILTIIVLPFLTDKEKNRRICRDSTMVVIDKLN